MTIINYYRSLFEEEEIQRGICGFMERLVTQFALLLFHILYLKQFNVSGPENLGGLYLHRPINYYRHELSRLPHSKLYRHFLNLQKNGELPRNPLISNDYLDSSQALINSFRTLELFALLISQKTKKHFQQNSSYKNTKLFASVTKFFDFIFIIHYNFYYD